MRDYKAKQRARLPLVAALYGIGFSVHSIAAIIGVSPATVINDRKALGGAKEFVERSGEKRSLYRNAFERYAAFCYESSLPGPPPRMDPAVAGILERWLRIREAKIALGGAAFAMAELLTPGYPPERAGYAKLLETVLGDWLMPESDAASRATTDFWQNYLAAVANHKISAPISYDDLVADTIRRYTANQRADVRPMWNESAFRTIDRVLGELTDRKQSVIRKRYGLDAKMMTLDQIGRELSFTRERVRQIEAEAIHDLRHPKRSSRLKPLVRSIEYLLADRLAADEPPPLEPPPETVSSAGVATPGFNRLLQDEELALIKNYYKSVDELDCSVRTMCAFRIADIRIIGELVQKRPPDMMKWRNFGRKSLKELVAELDRFGLRLNTVPAPDVLAHIQSNAAR